MSQDASAAPLREPEPKAVPPVVRGTAANLALAGAAGLAMTVAFYLLLLAPGIRGGYVYDVFCDRGPVQYATTLFFFWGVAILLLKIPRIRLEEKAFSLDLLTLEEGTLIRQEDALQYIRKLKRLSAGERSRLLTNRIWHALVRFKLLGSAEKVDDLLKYQAEMDDASMESNYSFLKFIIALVPILGFLGTVLGISAAVAGFSAVIGAAGSAGEGGLSAIQTALGKVTLGLGTAFDTTLIALVMSAILMFGLTLFQRWEEKLLSRIEEYCIENILDRLWVPPLESQVEKAMIRAVSSLPRQIAGELRQILKEGR